jgi:hypothetical protein
LIVLEDGYSSLLDRQIWFLYIPFQTNAQLIAFEGLTRNRLLASDIEYEISTCFERRFL